jgi:GR25 family glycosyltransferase involved in LPS biosynthesis
MIINSSIIKNIDFERNNISLNPIEAYMISLDDVVYNNGIKRIDLPIPIKKFDAVRGSTLTNYTKNSNNVSIRAQAILDSKYRDSTFDITTLNSIGCYLSHISLWYQVITNNLIGMYIFESDAKCTGNLDITEFSKTDGDILLFGSILIGDSYFDPVNFKREYNISKITQHFYGTHAYYITYKGALNALRNAFPIESQVDAYLSYLCKLNLINIYGYYPNICNQLTHISSLQTKYVKHHLDALLLIGIIGIIAFILIVLIIWICVKKIN